MKHQVAALALLMTACGTGAGSATTPAPSATASASAAPVTPTPSPSTAACRLPVAGGDAPTDGNPAHGARGHGGFLAIPAGTFTADPASLATYVLSAAKWVPVPRAWVSPDGKSYAYPEYRTAAGPVTGIIHVVDIASGADRPLGVPAPSIPVSWDAAGIYVARVVPNSDARPTGLSVLDPSSGGLRQITPSGTWTVVGSDSAYGADLDSSLAPPPGGGGPGAANRVWKLSLAGGSPAVVATFPGSNVSVLGVRGSDLVLGIVTADRFTVKAGSTTIYDGAITAPQPTQPIVVDGNAIWLSGAGGVWRSDGGGPARQFAVPGLQLAIAGGACR